MPSTYAHYRFGNSVFAKLPESVWETITEQIDLFYIGLHGPDILFYYRPLSKNPVSGLGHEMHKKAGLDFFEQAAEVVKAHDGDPAYLVYAYGVICHFALDRRCHGFVNEWMKETGVSHTEIEVEFDRRLLVYDGFDPLRTSLVDHLHPTKEAAGVIAAFYPGITEKQILEAVRSFVISNKILLAPGKAKRRLLNGCLKLAGQTEHVGKMVVNEKPNLLCKNSNERLGVLYQKAVPEAAALIMEFTQNMEGTKKWSDLYLDNFSSERPGA